MKAFKLFLIFVALIISAGGCVSMGKTLASGKGLLKYSEIAGGVIITSETSLMSVEFIEPAIIRVFWRNKNAKQNEKSLSVIKEAEKTVFTVSENPRSIEIATYALKAQIDMETGAITYLDQSGNVILRESGRFVEGKTVQDKVLYSIKQGFIFSPLEGLYGLGQFEDGKVNFRGEDMLLVQANRVAINPFLVSTAGYGILWDNYSQTKFHDGNDGAYFESEAAEGIDYYFVLGGTMDKTIAGYRKLTGKAPMFPKWAYGYWQSKERYKNQEEITNTFKEFRSRKLPIDAIVQDWQYWGENEYFSGMVWDKEKFPNPNKMTNEIHALNGHLMVSVWPAFGVKTDIYKEMQSKGFLFNGLHWCGGKVYDAYSEEARNIYWKYLKQGILDMGVDALWMDGTEPEFRCTDDRYASEASIKEAGVCALGPLEKYLNPYSLLTTQGVYDNYRKNYSDKRLFILSRSAFTGQQRNAAVTWSGDTFASWETLNSQIAAGINFSMSGIPYWTNDIGGFITSFHYPEGLSDPAYRELYVRWFEYATFLPIFRSHGTNIPREVWQFGKENSKEYKALEKFLELRYRLMPYIYSTAWKVYNKDYSFIRGLAMDFPKDTKALNISSQYMFGSSVLVCPVTKEMFEFSKNPGKYIMSKNLFLPDKSGSGLNLCFYKDTDFKEISAERKTDISNLGWFGCVPYGLEKNYSVRMTGMILADEAGMYEFSIITDGDARLWIDGRLIINKVGNRKENTFKGRIKLKAGTKYDIKAEHVQYNSWQALFKILWVKPDDADKAKEGFKVYLPKGTNWYDFWTGDKIKGGKTLTLKPALDMMPLYVPEGAIIPMGQKEEYATEKEAEPLEIMVYTGADGCFTIYEDENDNYNYEKGKYTEIPVTWKEKAKVLVIGKRTGEFEGMKKERLISVFFTDKKHGKGISPGIPDKQIVYKGEEVFVENLK